VLQYLFPFSGTQLHAGWAHLAIVVMGSPFFEKMLVSLKKRAVREGLELSHRMASESVPKDILTRTLKQHCTNAGHDLCRFAHPS
jgi:hypothetical protein